MAYFRWMPTTTPRDLGNVVNWRNSDSATGADLGPATVLPGANDHAWLTGELPANTTGTCYAGTAVTWGVNGPPPEIYGGIFNGNVTAEFPIHGGTFFGNVSSPGGIFGGTFYGTVTVSGSAWSPFVIQGSPQFYGDVIQSAGNIGIDLSASGIRFHERLRGSAWPANLWLYAPTSSHVAPSDVVLSGFTNLGVNGTYSPDNPPPSGGGTGSSGPSIGPVRIK